MFLQEVVSYKQALFLYLIYSSSAKIKSCELAKLLEVNKASISNMRTMLEEKNLINKKVRLSLCLSEEGMSICQEIEKYYRLICGKIKINYLNDVEKIKNNLFILMNISKETLDKIQHQKKS